MWSPQLLQNGIVVCPGFNYADQLGTNKTNIYPPTFTPATAVHGVNVSSVGGNWVNRCMLAAPAHRDTVYCDGNNDRGQLGSGRNDSSTVPVQGLQQSPPIAQLALFPGFACLIYAGPGSNNSMQCSGSPSANLVRPDHDACRWGCFIGIGCL